MLRTRRKRERFNIRVPAQYRSQTYRQWVAGWPCLLAGKAGHVCIPGRPACAHVRIKTDGSMGEKPSDWWTVPLCDDGLGVHGKGAHNEQHRDGEPRFYARYGIDPHKECSKLWWHPKNAHRSKYENDPDKTTALPPPRPGSLMAAE